MHILHIDTGREMRGGQWQVLYLLQGLAGAGHKVRLLAPPSSPLYRAAEEKGWECRPAGVGAIARTSGVFDLVHAHDARAHTLAAVAARRPLVVSRRVAFPIQRNPLSRWKYGRAARFSAVSEFVAARLREAGVPAEKISVVYDGVPAASVSTRAGPIVAPATDDPRKGSALLRQAAALGGFEVTFSTRLREDLRDASLFVYITREEGLGSAILMAMAAGVPVIASRVGGIPEALGDSGVLVENTPEAIAAAVAGREEAIRLAAGARRRIEEMFSLDSMVRGAVEVYHRVLTC
jgi:glycosyltransferase involved in cell wall biosynthesis